MSILSSIGQLAARYKASHDSYRAARDLYLLPMEIRKDIGWPELAQRHDMSATYVMPTSR